MGSERKEHVTEGTASAKAWRGAGSPRGPGPARKLREGTGMGWTELQELLGVEEKTKVCNDLRIILLGTGFNSLNLSLIGLWGN